MGDFFQSLEFPLLLIPETDESFIGLIAWIFHQKGSAYLSRASLAATITFSSVSALVKSPEILIFPVMKAVAGASSPANSRNLGRREDEKTLRSCR